MELLEDLCETMDDYTLVTPTPAAASSDSSSTGAEQEQQAQEQQVAAWVKYKGDGSVKVKRSER